MAKIVVTYADGREASGELLKPLPKYQVAFEEHFKISFVELEACYDEESNPIKDRPPRLAWIYFMAWSSLRQQGAVGEHRFADFLEAVEEIEIQGDPTPDEGETDDELDPTEPGRKSSARKAPRS